MNCKEVSWKLVSIYFSTCSNKRSKRINFSFYPSLFFYSRRQRGGILGWIEKEANWVSLILRYHKKLEKFIFAFLFQTEGFNWKLASKSPPNSRNSAQNFRKHALNSSNSAQNSRISPQNSRNRSFFEKIYLKNPMILAPIFTILSLSRKKGNFRIIWKLF